MISTGVTVFLRFGHAALDACLHYVKLAAGFQFQEFTFPGGGATRKSNRGVSGGGCTSAEVLL